MQTVALEDLVNLASGDQHAKAEQLFERAFNSLMWTRVTGRQVEDISPLKEWKHREPAEIESDLAYLGINRDELLGALSDYLSNPGLTSKYADWVFLNVLTYAEYLATVSEIRKQLMGIERYVEGLFPPKNEHNRDVSRYAKRSWHLPIALGGIALGCAIHALVGVTITLYVLFSAYQRKKACEQVNATLATMLQTYLSFNTVDLSWAHVTITLERSRDAGAMWDASLFALAERRVKAQSTVLASQAIGCVTI